MPISHLAAHFVGRTEEGDKKIAAAARHSEDMAAGNAASPGFFPWARVLIINGGAPLAVERHQGQNGANESSKGRGISDGTFQGV